MCLDKGYDYDEVREFGIAFGFTWHVRCRGEEAEALKKVGTDRARRWVVERTHSWTNRFRRIVRWEKRKDTFFAMLHLVCASSSGAPATCSDSHLHLSLASSAAWRFNLSELGVLRALAVQIVRRHLPLPLTPSQAPCVLRALAVDLFPPYPRRSLLCHRSTWKLTGQPTGQRSAVSSDDWCLTTDDTSTSRVRRTSAGCTKFTAAAG